MRIFDVMPAKVFIQFCSAKCFWRLNTRASPALT